MSRPGRESAVAKAHDTRSPAHHARLSGTAALLLARMIGQARARTQDLSSVCQVRLQVGSQAVTVTETRHKQ